MPPLQTAPRVRSVDPTTYPKLDGFTCGGGTPHEQEVDELVAFLRLGDWDTVAVRATEDPASGDLIGLCVVCRRAFRVTVAAYIGLIAISERWRGHRLPDGSRLGEFMLGDALSEIRRIWAGPPMPAVWALVAPENDASHNVFAHWGFGLIPGEPGGYDVRYRPHGLGLSVAESGDTGGR